ncbi:MAG: hypothetical protein EXR84_00960 [Gammaproteobacteria bacterium]|nr:hypothetical protein [Gammaproteobacteria bacterium]
MKNFMCACGNTLFFENTVCLQCGELVGFDPATMQMLPAAHSPASSLASGLPLLCKNAINFAVCNWLVEGALSTYCISCKLNVTIPNVMQSTRRLWWQSLENAKRRLLYSLLRLRLPIVGRDADPQGLAFQFSEDQRTNPAVSEELVTTGHLNGLITINIAEADLVNRAISQQFNGELYRTVLGHFRHESGHYYYNKLINNDDLLQQFRHLFGDETQSYSDALSKYYGNKHQIAHDPDMISHYAQSHPLEDWAEVWAHYLHMIDTLETAKDYGLHQGSIRFGIFDETLTKWSELTVLLNALNRSMGLEDAYPFVLSELTLRKLRFVHHLIYPS